MNSERQLDALGNSTGLFRSAFQSAVRHLAHCGRPIQDVSLAELLVATAAEQEKRVWYFEEDGVTGRDLSLYDTVMLDYWDSLQSCLDDTRENTTLESCLHLLFQ